MENETLGRSRLRSRQRIIVDILAAARQGAERHKIIKQAGVNYRQFSGVINALLAKGLVTVTESPEGKIIFKATTKGNRYVETYRLMMGRPGAIINSPTMT